MINDAGDSDGEDQVRIGEHVKHSGLLFKFNFKIIKNIYINEILQFTERTIPDLFFCVRTKSISTILCRQLPFTVALIMPSWLTLSMKVEPEDTNAKHSDIGGFQ